MPGAPGIALAIGVGESAQITVYDNDVSPVIDTVTIIRTLPGVESVVLTRTLVLVDPGHSLPPEGTFSDYQWRHGKQYEYVAIGYDSSGNASPPSAVVSGIGTLETAAISSVAKAADTNVGSITLQLYNQEGQRRNYDIESNVLIMPGRSKPVIKVSPIVGFSIDIPVLIPLSDKTSVMPALDVILRSNAVFTFRDALGNFLFGTFGNNSINTGIRSEFTLTITETDYQPSVD
jgi:hypothetical protein